jgi:catecholate siderophore receptor
MMHRLSVLLFSLLLVLNVHAEGTSISAVVVDSSGGAIQKAHVVLQHGSTSRNATSDSDGRFSFEGLTGAETLLVVAEGFEALFIERATEAPEQIILEPAPMSEVVTVKAPRPQTHSMTATKTDTPLRDVPQAITVITSEVIGEQTMQGMADVVRYVPGVGIAQGEGNRDTPVFRGNSSTSDFFVDGIRDDVQYFRDLYNVQRVEALKGPNAMIFGRGGVGGVLNRVTRQADWTPANELTLQGGSWNDRRLSGDFGRALSERFAARATGMYQQSDSYRDGASLERYGFNPTFALALGDDTTLRGGFELFHDDRTADRGISSFAGRPVETESSTFFGNPDLSKSRADIQVWTSSLDHRLSETTSLRSRLSYADYDKSYQNVFPGAVDQSGRNVNISAYSNATERQNLFSQTDLVMTPVFGRFKHTILAGVELGRQLTDNDRKTGYFNTQTGAGTTSIVLPIANPTTSTAVTFRQSATDADNHGVATVGALYVQDQLTLTSKLEAIAGVRYDRFRVDFRNNRTGAVIESTDALISPRLGLVFKPVPPVSLYASYSLTYLPRAGEQLSSLSVTNRELEPEEFRNYEVGAKLDVANRVELTTAVYRLDRRNVAVADPANPIVSMLVDGQRSEGLELSAAGNVTDRWSMIAAYAFQKGEILESLSATARAGARLAQLPEHSASLWNKVDLSSAWGLGLGVVYRDAIFTSTDNSVTLPSFTRIDAAVYYAFGPRLRAQLNVENLLDTAYFASAHSNNNITPGSPRAIRMSWSTRF